MAMMKDYLMTVEELVYDAMELGFRGVDGIYSYVYMYENHVDKETIEFILENILVGLDEADLMLYNSTVD